MSAHIPVAIFTAETFRCNRQIALFIDPETETADAHLCIGTGDDPLGAVAHFLYFGPDFDIFSKSRSWWLATGVGVEMMCSTVCRPDRIFSQTFDPI